MRWAGLLLLGACATAAPAPFPQLDKMPGQAAPPGNVVVLTDPEDAQVSVDGVTQGLGSDFDGVHGALQLSAGPHTLSVTHGGYKAFSATVFASSEGKQTLQVSLEKQ